MSLDLTNRRIIVTGITGGIARATTQLLSSLGAELIVTARSQQKLDQSLTGIDGNIKGYVLDLTEESSIKNFYAQVGKFDHLVTPAASSMLAPINEMNFKAARELFETKQWGQMLSVYYALPYLSQSGSITLFSGTVTQKPLPGATIFAAAGAATEAAGRIWAYELAPVRVNTIVPGVIDTPAWTHLTGSKEAAQAQLDAVAELLPVKRIGKPEDIAKSVAFLIDNDFIDGISLVVDGGHRLI